MKGAPSEDERLRLAALTAAMAHALLVMLVLPVALLLQLPRQGLAAWRGLEATKSLAYRASRVQQNRLVEFRQAVVQVHQGRIGAQHGAISNAEARGAVEQLQGQATAPAGQLQQKRQGAVAGTRLASSSTASGLAVQNSANCSGVSRRLSVSVPGRLRGASMGPAPALA